MTFRLYADISISTHALTEGDLLSSGLPPICYISTHALTEGDYLLGVFSVASFISTHALTEGDSAAMSVDPLPPNISTHALTEGDSQRHALYSGLQYFNSRPHGGRLHDF